MAGLSKGIEMLKASGSSNTPIVILVCDGDIYYDNNIVGEAIRNNIPVFCINVVNGSSAVMEQIARDIFPNVDNDRIYFSTENKEDFEKTISTGNLYYDGNGIKWTPGTVSTTY